MKIDPLFSVIVPTYNRSKVIRKCLESVLGQDIDDYEIIVVDDNGRGSKEQLLTAKAINDLIDKACVNYVVLERNGNGAKARNIGIDLAKGKYIAFLDDDDEWFPTKLSAHCHLLPHYKELEGSYSRIARFRKGVRLSESAYNKSGNVIVDLLMLKSEMFTSSLVIRTDILRKIGGFDERLKRHQDYDLLCKFFKEHKINCIDKALVRINSDDRSNMPDFRTFEKNKMFFLNLFSNQITELGGDLSERILCAHFMELEFYAIRRLNFLGIMKYMKYFKWKEFIRRIIRKSTKG